MKRISFKQWFHKPDEEGVTGEQIVIGSFMIPIFSFILSSINSRAIDFGIIPLAFIIQGLYVVIYYLIDSRIR